MAGLGVHPLVRKLNALVALSEQERAALLRAMGPMQTCAAHEDVVRVNEKAGGVAVIVSGFACQQRMLPDGRRQIVAYFLPGDMCDSTNVVPQNNHCSITALASSTVVMLSHRDIKQISSSYSQLARAFWCHTMVEAAIGREWLINVGQRTALERLAHLFCEVSLRMEAVSGVSPLGCNLPVTQSELADTAALSTVHVNRTLKELRRLGLVSLENKKLIIHDLAGLRALAMFDPKYLHPVALVSSVDTFSPSSTAATYWA